MYLERLITFNNLDIKLKPAEHRATTCIPNVNKRHRDGRPILTVVIEVKYFKIYFIIANLLLIILGNNWYWKYTMLC